MQVCTSSQITTPTSHHSVFLQAGCPSFRPTNSVKALKAKSIEGKENGRERKGKGMEGSKDGQGEKRDSREGDGSRKG